MIIWRKREGGGDYDYVGEALLSASELRHNLNNPVVVWRKWTAATRVKKFKPRSAGVSGTEHSRARAMVEQLQERGMELDQEREEARQQAEALRVLLSRVLDEVDDLPEELRSAIEAALR